MFAPIITKDMKLFPSQPLSSCIKNVRSRAQMLQDDSNMKQQRISNISNGGHRRTRSKPQIIRTVRTAPHTSSILLRSPPKLDAILEGVELQSKRSYTDDCSSTTSSATTSSSSSVSSTSILDVVMTSSELNISANNDASTISIVSAPVYTSTAKNYRKRFLKMVAKTLKLKSTKRAVIFGRKNATASCPQLSSKSTSI